MKELTAVNTGTMRDVFDLLWGPSGKDVEWEEDQFDLSESFGHTGPIETRREARLGRFHALHEANGQTSASNREPVDEWALKVTHAAPVTLSKGDCNAGSSKRIS